MNSVKIQGKQHLTEALHSLSGTYKNEEGRISWNSADLDRGTFEVIYNLTFTPTIEDHLKDGAVWYALNECARANVFSSRAFLRHLHVYFSNHFTKQTTVLAIAQLNIRIGSTPPFKIVSANGSVEIRTALPTYCRQAINKLKSHERDTFGLHDDFVFITYPVTATDDRSAIDIAYRVMRYAVGVLNIATNGFGVGKRFGYPNAPLGSFLLTSPIFTINPSKKNSGELANGESLSDSMEAEFRGMATPKN